MGSQHVAGGQLAAAEVVVVGLGLMGGSLAGALRGKCKRVIGLARRQESVDEALDMGLIDSGTTDLAEAVREADVVVLSTPVRVIMRQLEEIATHVPEGCVVMDLGSTKSLIAKNMATLPEHIEPIGAHPMCGKEVSGLGAADPSLYEGRTFILCPLPRTAPAALALAQQLARAIGARPLLLSPERQDYLSATLSHLPYLLACALVATADATTSSDPAAWEIVAGGFRDTSRVASSDVTMMTDILLTNRDEVLGALAAFTSQLQVLTDLVAEGDERAIRLVLERIRSERTKMFP